MKNCRNLIIAAVRHLLVTLLNNYDCNSNDDSDGSGDDNNLYPRNIRLQQHLTQSREPGKGHISFS